MITIKQSPCKVTWGIYFGDILLDTQLTKWEAEAVKSKLSELL